MMNEGENDAAGEGISSGLVNQRRNNSEEDVEGTSEEEEEEEEGEYVGARNEQGQPHGRGIMTYPNSGVRCI